MPGRANPREKIKRFTQRSQRSEKRSRRFLKNLLWALSPVRCFNRRRRPLGKRLELGNRSVRRIFIFLCDLFSDLCDLCVNLSARSGSSFSVLFQSRLPLRSSCSSNGPGMPRKGYKKIHPFPRNEPFARGSWQSQFRRRTSVRAQMDFHSTGYHPHYSPCDSSPLNFHFGRHHVSRIGHSQVSGNR